ncbi:DUF4123 domain-containing protein [Thalassospira xiamenensis]|uniref:DUF4123 domain-containing protein n=1 Tax=Thalassospira xiamenensis TaxID=220697 RepID=UPI000A88EE99|nr:DUF4123 domain-containing protein [Thalassospira xiamenensis]MCK2168554.1 DUF4123 domain-containing protein [Thalassospira xiamenensis]
MNALESEAAPWLGHCQFLRSATIPSDDAGDETAKPCQQGYVAVWTTDRKGFDDTLRTYLSETDTDERLKLVWSENVMPATEWMARNPRAKEALDLARRVHEGRLVEIGPLAVPAPREDAEPEPVDWLKIVDIENVEPLDMQIGATPPMNVPHILAAPLFGPHEPTAVEAGEADGNTDNVPPMRTYAILDAAKMPYLLTSHLEESGLRYQSLFQGAAQKELAEQAPYLVELKQDNRLTRTLFTGPDGACGLWEKEPGIYIRSRASFDDVRNHFRKFTRICDEKGKWYYFRFWEGANLYQLAPRNGGQSVLSSLLHAPIEAILAKQRGRPAFRILSAIPHPGSKLPEFRHMDEQLLDALDDVIEENIRTGLAADLASNGPNGLDFTQASSRVDHLWSWLKGYGMRDSDALKQATLGLAALSPEEAEADHRIAGIMQQRSLGDKAKARLLGRITAS